MVDLDILKAHGITPDNLKKAFALARKDTGRGKTKQSSAELATTNTSQRAKVERLIERIGSRIADGRNFNLTNYRIFEALDEAWDATLDQITPTMLKSLTDKSLDLEASMSKLKSWGINPDDYIVEYDDPKTPGAKLRKISIPAFQPVRVTLARSYTTIRWAKLVNDRNQVPHFKYEPAISDEMSRMRCELVTARSEEISNQYGAFETEKQIIQKTLLYGQQLVFPMEAWHYEEQLVGEDSGYLGEKVTFGGKTYLKAVVKEGIRYHLPHPARTYRDQAHYPSTYNTDTGASFAGYWRIQRYGELLDNDNFWNLDKVAIMEGDWYTPGQGLFENVFPCTMEFPSYGCSSDGVGEGDAERVLGDGFYSTDHKDKGILVNEYFEKLNPKKNGLGDYVYDVWFRFVIAADNTIIFCEPIAYAPIISYAYDADEAKATQSSMMLEILPFEIQLSNLFTQYIVSVIQNLYNISLVDTDVADEATLQHMRTAPAHIFTGFNILEFSSKKFQTAQTNPRVLYSERFPQVDVNSVALSIRMCLEMVERLLVMSPQEMGQAASHEQTREEVRVISSHSSSRLEFTGATFDRGREVIKRQYYEGSMAYGEDEYLAQIPANPEITKDNKALLEKLGMTWQSQDTDSGRVTVKSTKTAVKYLKFVANRDGADRINEGDLANKMSQVLMQALSNPITSAAVGPDQAIGMLNHLVKAAGFPRDFRLVNKMNDQTLLQQNNQQLMQEVQQLVQQAMQQMSQDVKGALQTIMQDNQTQTEQIAKIEQTLAAALQSPQPEPGVMQMPMGMPPEMEQAMPAMA